MALSKLAVHRLIPAGSNDPRLAVIDGVVLHVDAGNADSLYAYFNGPSGGIESHFFIKRDGTIEQYRDTQYEADANYDGNSYVGTDGKLHGLISIETQGYGNGEWTPQQLASIKRLLIELSDVHGFPLRKIPAWNGRGVGYHTMWGAPSHWTPVAKTCPGPDRIKQYDTVLVPWFPHAHDLNKLDPFSYYVGATGQHVTWLGRRLIAHGFDKRGDADGYQPGRVFTEYDRANVRDAQIARGVSEKDATGLPGKALLVYLARPPKQGPDEALQQARANIKDAIDELGYARPDHAAPAKQAQSWLRRALRALRLKK